MKILHICLANFFIDNFGYQENIITKMHKLQGHTVEIVASTETYVNNNKLGYISPGEYTTSDDIPVVRIPYTRFLPHFVARKLRIYVGLTKILNKFSPDIIFLHNVQFVSITEIIKYVKANKKVIIYADSHTDFINSGRNWISKSILHGIVYKWCAKKIIPYVKKFYGTLPSRVDFLANVYNVPQDKLELLVFGVDDTKVDFSKEFEIKKLVRANLSLQESDFVIISGGKLDRRKNIHMLMRAVNELKHENIKLIIFGTPSVQMEKEILYQAKGKNIHYLGWLSPDEIYNYLSAADLAFFPGTHSVIWEQSVGVGLPAVFKRWDKIDHIDIGGNCIFLEEVNIDTIKDIIIKLYNDKQLFSKMKEKAKKGIKKFSYYEIAKRAIEQ